MRIEFLDGPFEGKQMTLKGEMDDVLRIPYTSDDSTELHIHAYRRTRFHDDNDVVAYCYMGRS